MKIGTKTLLFGGHQFLLHPAYVWIAWVKIFNKPPNWKETICIAIHDWGYWGKENIDGKEGETHPEGGAIIASKIFKDPLYYDLCLYHSRFLAFSRNRRPSKLCAADKLGVTLYPTWLWYVLVRLSGELAEYQSNPKYVADKWLKTQDPRGWFRLYKKTVPEWIKSGRIYTHIDQV